MEDPNLIETLVKEHKYQEAERLAKQLSKFDFLIQALEQHKKVRRAAQILKKNGLLLESYPGLLQGIKRRYVRYAMRIESAHKAELRLLTNKELLGIMTEELFMGNRVNEALSLLQRNCLQDFIKIPELISASQEGFLYMPNTVIDEDTFGEMNSALRELAGGQDIYLLSEFRYPES